MNDLDGMRSGIILGSQIFPGFFYNISAFSTLLAASKGSLRRDQRRRLDVGYVVDQNVIMHGFVFN